jgi:hypothetical protein
MQLTISYITTPAENEATALLFSEASAVSAFYNNRPEQEFVEKSLSDEAALISLNQYVRQLFFIKPKAEIVSYRRKEALRKTGADLFKQVSGLKLETLQIASFTDRPDDIYACAKVWH